MFLKQSEVYEHYKLFQSSREGRGQTLNLFLYVAQFSTKFTCVENLSRISSPFRRTSFLCIQVPLCGLLGPCSKFFFFYLPFSNLAFCSLVRQCPLFQQQAYETRSWNDNFWWILLCYVLASLFLHRTFTNTWASAVGCLKISRWKVLAKQRNLLWRVTGCW